MNLPPFEVDAIGVFDTSRLQIVWRDEKTAPEPELDRMVEQVWRRELQRARRLGGHLFNGQLVRYLRHELREGSLRVEVGWTDYARFMGTNYLNWHRGDELGWERYSNPLGVSANVVTCDGWMVLGRRNEKVACHPGYVHSLGGSLEASERQADGRLDAFACMRRELREEAGIEAEDLEEMVCLGIIRDPYVRQPELIFDARLRLTLEEVTRRVHASDEEHTGVEACRDTGESIETFVRTTQRIAPVAVGALCLHGRRRYGEEWLGGLVRRLPPPVPPFPSELQDGADLGA